LLEQAEAELKKVAPVAYDSQKVAADLQAKQDMSIALRKATEEMLRKLRDLCSTLTTMTAPERKPLLQKEVSSHKEYSSTLTHFSCHKALRNEDELFI